MDAVPAAEGYGYAYATYLRGADAPIQASNLV